MNPACPGGRVRVLTGNLPSPPPFMGVHEQVNTSVSTTLMLTLLAGFGFSAQSQAQGDLVAKKEAKLKKAFLQNATWYTDYDKARAAAKKSNKVLFTYFTRSYSP